LAAAGSAVPRRIMATEAEANGKFFVISVIPS
jgi:hypothetical protein